MRWAGKELKTAGDIIDMFVKLQTRSGVQAFVDAYHAQCPKLGRSGVIGNLSFGLSRFYADGCDEDDPREVKATQLRGWLRDLAVTKKV